VWEGVKVFIAVATFITLCVDIKGKTFCLCY